MKQVIILITIVSMLSACGTKQTTEEKPEIKTAENLVILTDAQLKNAAIETGKLEQQSISSILKVNGSIDVPPQNMVSISVPLGGYLKFTHLLPGMHVNKGESIAVIEDQQYIQLQQDYLTSKAKLLFARQEYERQKELNQSKASSDKVYQQALADYTSLDVLVKSLSEKLKLIGINPATKNAGNISKSVSIPSPINGFVSKVNVNIGKYVNPSDVLFEIVNPSDIHLVLTVFEKDINKLFIGQKLIAYTNTNPEKKYPCKIILIGKDFSNDRSVEVRCHFESYDKSLIPGMYMNAEIEVKSDSVFALPSDAIVNYENKQYMFISKGNNQFEIAEVKTGNSENGFTEIILSDNQNLKDATLVTKGAYTLLMKMKNTSDE